ncbi:unnamed protein product [Lepidochelys olivacea]
MLHCSKLRLCHRLITKIPQLVSLIPSSTKDSIQVIIEEWSSLQAKHFAQAVYWPLGTFTSVTDSIALWCPAPHTKQCLQYELRTIKWLRKQDFALAGYTQTAVILGLWFQCGTLWRPKPQPFLARASSSIPMRIPSDSKVSSCLPGAHQSCVEGVVRRQEAAGKVGLGKLPMAEGTWS